MPSVSPSSPSFPRRRSPPLLPLPLIVDPTEATTTPANDTLIIAIPRSELQELRPPLLPLPYPLGPRPGAYNSGDAGALRPQTLTRPIASLSLLQPSHAVMPTGSRHVARHPGDTTTFGQPSSAARPPSLSLSLARSGTAAKKRRKG